MKKRFVHAMQRALSLTLALTMVACLFSICAVRANADAAVRSRKIVSVVYDDSGSMDGNKWPYANYAMQAFCAMLNKDDAMSVTYMSSPGNSENIDLSDPNAAVSAIRNHSATANTPYESVTTACRKLESTLDNNQNTQYWLVIFTDGGFNDCLPDEVSRNLENFVSKKMPNGTTPKIVFMTIGDTTDSYTPHSSHKDITIISANEEDQIVSSLFDIASQVSGRFPADKGSIKKLDDNSISVTSNVPLLKIGVITQETDAAVKEVKAAENIGVPICSSADIRSPSDPPTKGSDSSARNMRGHVALAGETDKNLPAGDYVITFTKAIDLDKLIVLFEPALELRLRVTVDGTPVDDLSVLSADLPGVAVEAVLYEFGTDNVVLPSMLPAQAVSSITHTVDGAVQKTGSALKLEIIPAKGSNEVHADFDLPGFFRLEGSICFDIAELTITAITAELMPDGSDRLNGKDGTPDGPDVVYISNIENNRTGIRFICYEDGVPLSYEKALAAEKTFKDGLNVSFKRYTVEVLPDGSYLVFPGKIPWYYNRLIYYWVRHGEQTVQATIGQASDSGTLVFEHGPWPEFIWPAISIGLILYFILFWLPFKKHFPRGTIVFSIGQDDRGRFSFSQTGETLRLNYLGGFSKKHLVYYLWKLIAFLSPFAPKTKLRGFTFVGQDTLFSRSGIIKILGVKGCLISDTPNGHQRRYEDDFCEMSNCIYIEKGSTRSGFTLI